MSRFARTRPAEIIGENKSRVQERFFALAHDLMCVVDRDRRFVAANPAWTELTGWSSEDLVGRNYANLQHPDDVAPTDIAHSVALSGTVVEDFVARLRRTDGEYLWVLWTATSDPETGLTYAIGKDVTTRMQTRLASQVNHSDDAIITKGLDLKILSVNAGAERMYGYTADEMIGKPIAMLIPPDRDGEDHTIFAWVLAGETIDHFETARRRKDGSTVDVSVSVSAIRDASGRVIGTSSIARDITETRALVQAHDEVVKRLLLAAEFRDNATSEHIHRMSGLCAQIAAGLGWSRQCTAELQSAAAMHDIGKIAVPDSILLEPGELSSGQRAVMETHAEKGYLILTGTGIPLLEQAAEIALTHHERFDGTGYPGGLCGEEIPLSGRIAAVADVFDALTSDRPYRPAYDRTEALRIMREGGGTRFDPRVLGVLAAVVLTDELTSPSDSTSGA
jgi:PAS domain S-box-containing protein